MALIRTTYWELGFNDVRVIVCNEISIGKVSPLMDIFPREEMPAQYNSGYPITDFQCKLPIIKHTY